MVHILFVYAAEHVEPFSTKYLNCFFTKEELEKHIESREQSAASVLCHLLRTSPTEDPETTFASGIIGVVALLGAVEHIELSWYAFQMSTHSTLLHVSLWPDGYKN